MWEKMIPCLCLSISTHCIRSVCALLRQSQTEPLRREQASSVGGDRKAERGVAERRTLQQRLIVVMNGLLLDELLDASDAANGARSLCDASRGGSCSRGA
jgi:hypothetical protein